MEQTITTADHGVTVQYIATPTTSTMPTAPTMPQSAGQGRLPQTGDEAKNTLASIGLAMLGLLSGLSFLSHKYQRRNEH